MGLGEFVRATAEQARKDHLGAYAGNLAYRSLFAVFPALVSLFWLLKLVGANAAINGLGDLASTALPKTAGSAVKEQISSVSGAQANGALTLGAVVASLAAIWAVASAFRAAMEALNAMYAVEESRSLAKRQLVSLLLSLAVSALLAGALALLVLGPGIAHKLSGVAGAGAALHWLWLVGTWPALILGVLVAFALVYYFAPDVEQEFRWIGAGTVISVLFWLVFAALFSLYINNLAAPTQTYGALAGVAVLMIYAYCSSFILLLGAEMNQVIEMRHPEGKNEGEKQPG